MDRYKVWHLKSKEMGCQQVYFLIDLENVHNPGMAGAEYLEPQDTLLFFYSESSKYLEHRYLLDVERSGCALEIYCLKHMGKNALDFYIAVCVGEILTRDPQAHIAIISRDKGYTAVCEFAKMRSEGRCPVFQAHSIENAILQAERATPRTKSVQEQLTRENIESFYSLHKERNRIKRSLRTLFSGTEYEEKLGEILDVIAGEDRSPKVVYLDSLRRFGRKSGLEIYQKLKESAIFQEAQPLEPDGEQQDTQQTKRAGKKKRRRGKKSKKAQVEVDSQQVAEETLQAVHSV